MELERYNGCGSTEMETPYGVARVEVTQEANRLNVNVRDTEGRMVVRTSYERSGNQDWQRADAKKGVRSATWGFNVVKKERHNMLVVLDAVTLAWAKNHEAELRETKAASLRARAWNMARTANQYADYARKYAEQAEEVAA